MQIRVSRLSILAAIAGVSAVATHAQAQATWTGASGIDNNWSTGTNWSTNAEPTASQNAFLNNGGTIQVDQADEVANFVDLNAVSGSGSGTLDIRAGAVLSTTNSVRIGIGAGSNGTLLMSGGTVTINPLSTTADFTVGDGGATANRARGSATISGNGTLTAPDNMLVGGGADADGTVTHTGGSLTIGNAVVVGGGARSTGIYNLSGSGSLTQSATTNALILGNNGTASGTFTQAGGTLNANAMQVGNNGTGAYTHSAGDLSVTNAITIGVAGTANGTFTVRGSSGSISAGSFTAGTAGAGTKSLVLEILDSSGVTLIDVAGNATLDGITIDMNLDGYIPSGGQTFDLLTASAITGGALNPADTDDWSLAVVSGGSGQILQATYVPEPGMLSVAAIGGMMLLGRRRRNVQ
ncbi:MAG TPA: hypothetical protein VGR35_08490 [Tepidisphaeraceae bacterium]|nr:hypothetical protein [Tepidisphaeraceae bacterium]